MATVPVGVMGGMATGQKNQGLPVVGGNSGKNGLSPTASIPTQSPVSGPINGARNPITSPIMSAGATGTAPSKTAGGLTTATAQGAQPPVVTPPQAGANPAAPNAPNNGNTIAGYTPQQTQQLQKQLTDIYGKGEGGLLFQQLSNLGSNDSSYMQAYEQAMQHSTAEGLSTIDTGLGNAGISANSSAAAIEKGDYLSSVTSQEGLQEQQLIQQQQQEAIGLTQGLQEDSKAENSTSWLNTAAQVAGIAGTFVGDATGLSSIGSGISSLFKGAAPGALPNVSSGADPLGLQAPSMPSGINLPVGMNSSGSTIPVF